MMTCMAEAEGLTEKANTNYFMLRDKKKCRRPRAKLTAALTAGPGSSGFGKHQNVWSFGAAYPASLWNASGSLLFHSSAPLVFQH